MKVSKLLDKLGNELYTISPDSTIAECVEELNARHIGVLVVVDLDGTLLGAVSERDVLRKAYAAETKTVDCARKVEEIMRRVNEMPTATMDTHLHEVMKLMTENRTRHMVIVQDDGRAIGCLSVRDIIEHLLQAATRENEELQNYMYSW